MEPEAFYFCLKLSQMDNYLPVIILVIAIAIFLLYRFKDEITMKFQYEDFDGTIDNWAVAIVKGEKQFHPMISYATDDGTVRFRADEFCIGEPMYPLGTAVIIRTHLRKKALRRVIYPKR
jgi:hypothetical protein